LAGASITNAGLAHLAAMPTLEELDLSVPAASVSGLTALGALPRLRVLRVDRIGGDESGLDISGLSGLEWFRIWGPEFLTDGDLASLAGLKQLQHLDFAGAITDAGMAPLAGLENLTWLQISGRFGDEGLARLAGLGRLETLYLTGGRITADGLAHLEGIETLTYVAIESDAPISPTVSRRMVARMPNLMWCAVRMPQR
jgi:hypothetical protein